MEGLTNDVERSNEMVFFFSLLCFHLLILHHYNLTNYFMYMLFIFGQIKSIHLITICPFLWGNYIHLLAK